MEEGALSPSAPPLCWDLPVYPETCCILKRGRRRRRADLQTSQFWVTRHSAFQAFVLEASQFLRTADRWFPEPTVADIWSLYHAERKYEKHYIHDFLLGKIALEQAMESSRLPFYDFIEELKTVSLSAHQGIFEKYLRGKRSQVRLPFSEELSRIFANVMAGDTP